MSTAKMPTSIDDLPIEILSNGILLKLSLANRLNQRRTCRRWKALMPLKDEDLKVIPLVDEMIELWHRNEEEVEKAKRPRQKWKMKVSHSLQECKGRLKSKAPKIIEKCLKILFDSEKQQNFCENLKILKIVDESEIWTLNAGCLNYITDYLKRLEIIDISGFRMIPALQICKFLDELNVWNLKELRLVWNDEKPMHWDYCDSIGVQNSITDLLQRCPKLEKLNLNLIPIPILSKNEATIRFPANFQQLTMWNHTYPEKFRFASLDECREKITKLDLEIWLMADEEWTELVDRPFPGLQEFSIISSFPNAKVLAKFCGGHPLLKKLTIQMECKNLQVADLAPIRSLQELTELYLYFSQYYDSNIILDSNLVATCLNPNLRKLAVEVKEAEESVLLNISGLCGRNLEYFSLSTDSFKFRGKFWSKFLVECPNLRELEISQSPKPNVFEIAGNLPNGLKNLLIDFRSKERSIIMKWIRDFCEERIKLNRTEKTVILDTSSAHRSDFYEQLKSITEQANVELVIK